MGLDQCVGSTSAFEFQPPPQPIHEEVFSDTWGFDALFTRNEEPTIVADFDDEDGDIDVLNTSLGSDDEENETKKYSRFRIPGDDVDIHFERGLIFNTKKDIKEVVKTIAMVNKKNLKVVQNDLKRYVVKFMLGCRFKLRVSKLN